VKLDIKMALLGVGIGVIGTIASLYLRYGVGLGVTVMSSSLVYLLVNKLRVKDGTQQLSTVKSRSEHPSHPSFLMLTTIVFAFLLISSFSFLYHRPLEYFIAVAIFSAVIVVEIGLLRSHSSKLDLYNILAQILLLAAAVRWSALFAFPSFVGVDPWDHSLGVKHILRTGHVFTALDMLNYDFIGYSSLAQYGSRPIMHIFTSQAQLLASFPSLKYAFTFSVGIFEIISLLFVFILSRKILNDTKGAALASLLVAMSNFHIRWGFWMIPMTMGLAFFSLLLCLQHLNQETWNQREVQLLSLLTVIVLVFTHSIAAFIGILILFSYWMADKTLGRSFYTKKRKKIFSLLLVLATVMLAANWTFSYFTDVVIRYALTSTTFMPMNPTVRNLTQFEIDNVGIYILYFCAILGVLTWSKRLDRDRKLIILGVVLLSILTYGSGLIGLHAILPERWFAFLFVILAPIAAEGYRFLERCLRKGKMILPLVVLLFTFFMVTSSTCNTDSPLFYPETAPPRVAFKESEMMAAQAATSIFEGNIYMDQRYTACRYLLERRVISLDFGHFHSNNIDGLILSRKFIYTYNTTLARTLENELSKMNKVYSNGEVDMFLSSLNISRNSS